MPKSICTNRSTLPSSVPGANRTRFGSGRGRCTHRGEGVAAHWLYKKGRASAGEQAKIEWLREAVEWLQEMKDPRNSWIP